MKRLLIILTISVLAVGAFAKTNARTELGAPDLEAIAEATTDPLSPRFYPKLLKSFMANDTVMSIEDYQYFYYGTLFQEDYDPYREAPNPELLEELQPIYAKAKRSRNDCERMQAYATQVLNDNPIDLRQLTNKIYVYEQTRKYDSAKIWQHKLNRLLLVIAASGTGADPESAFIVVYPQHEYDFLNLSGITAQSQRFEPPYYDYIEAVKPGTAGTTGYYFNIREMLDQYFAKHPSEDAKK